MRRLLPLFVVLLSLASPLFAQQQIQVIPTSDSLFNASSPKVRIVIPGAHFDPNGVKPEVRLGTLETNLSWYSARRSDIPPYSYPIYGPYLTVLAPDTLEFYYRFGNHDYSRMDDLEVKYNGVTYRKDSAFYEYRIYHRPVGADSATLTPLRGYAGESIEVEITGQGTHFEQTSPAFEADDMFANALIVDFHNDPTIITYSPVQVFSTTRMVATITIPANTLPGQYDVSLLTPKDGARFINNGFTVLSGTPLSQGHIKGRVYVDGNHNCISDTSDLGLGGVIMEANPGHILAVTDRSGYYDLFAPFGTYTVSRQLQPGSQPTCPVGPSDPVTISRDTSIRTGIDFADTAVPFRDLAVYGASSNARPGFPVNYSISVSNTSSLLMAGTLRFIPDPVLEAIPGSGNADSTHGDTLFWNLSLPGGHTANYAVQSRVPADVQLLGTQIRSRIDLINLQNDVVAGNNAYTIWNTVRGSYDPNDKSVEPAGPLRSADSVLTYTIRFQNSGTDTAFTVSVRDTLSTNLDVASIKTLIASHPYSFRLKGTQNAEWRFDNILLPDSGVNEQASHGFVKFSINRRKSLPPGAPINNQAHIYFDFNPGVATNMVSNTIVSVREEEASTGQAIGRALIVPNPVTGHAKVQLQGEEAHGDATLTVVDALGKPAYEANNISGKLVSFGKIFCPGVYFLRIRENGQTLAQGRFIVADSNSGRL